MSRSRKFCHESQAQNRGVRDKSRDLITLHYNLQGSKVKKTWVERFLKSAVDFLPGGEASALSTDCGNKTNPINMKLFSPVSVRP